MMFHIALGLALLGSLALGLILWLKADRVPGRTPLALFLLGVAAWITGNEWPTWFGPASGRIGLSLMATASLSAAAFFHFTVAFTRLPARRWVVAAYAAGGAATLLSVLVLPGAYVPFAGMAYVSVPNRVGWVTSLVWAFLAAAGNAVLLRAVLQERGLARRQIAAAMGASAWGLCCMTGYAAAALDLPVAPWPLLGLPLYPVFLVYGILRYELLLANAWARRALGWSLLVGVAGLMVAALPLLGPWSGTPFATGLMVGTAFLILGGPVRRLAERIVYPGGVVTPDDLRAWRADLALARTEPELAARATALLSRTLATPVHVVFGASAPAGPVLRCERGAAGWASALGTGWEAAPPGPQRVAETLGLVLADEAARLERATALAQQERERQTQARLAELGALAATVAHDVRNPLNIIGMAVALAEPEVRTEVAGQIRRISRLADDLLDYAKPWSIQPARMDLSALCRTVAARHGAAAHVPGTWCVVADAGRLEQALDNLLSNASAVAGTVRIIGEGCRLHVCDDGPGIPDDLRGRIFEPFVSRGSGGRGGGTGLGLAIVARIAAAHGGGVALTDRPGWSTCVTLTLTEPAV